MIIRDGDEQAGDEDTSTLTLVSADEATELTLRVASALRADLHEHLAAQGFHVPAGDARSVVSEVVVATASSPAAWTALGGIVVAFLRRHRGKVHRFDVEGQSVSIEGYSAKDAERLAENILTRSRERGKRGESDGMSLGSRA